MTVPMEYQHASEDFMRFLGDAKAALDFETRNPAFTTVQGVLLAFRRRLDAEQVLAFADVLPPTLRAIFVAGWRPSEKAPAFGSRDQLLEEVKSLRRHHNLTPDNAIEAVADTVRRHVDNKAFEAVLGSMPEGAEAFWAGRPR